MIQEAPWTARKKKPMVTSYGTLVSSPLDVHCSTPIGNHCFMGKAFGIHGSGEDFFRFKALDVLDLMLNMICSFCIIHMVVVFMIMWPAEVDDPTVFNGLPPL